MKRVLAILTIAVAGIVPAVAAAELEYALSQPLLDFIAATPDSRDLAVGEGKVAVLSGDRDQVTFTGHGTPTDARGEITYHAISEVFEASEHGTVDCVNVFENRAALSGQFDEPVLLGGEPAEYFLVLVEDNGEPTATDLEPDRARVVVATNDQDCTETLAFTAFTPLPVEQGNVVVMDRP